MPARASPISAIRVEVAILPCSLICAAKRWRSKAISASSAVKVERKRITLARSEATASSAVAVADAVCANVRSASAIAKALEARAAFMSANVF